MNYRLEYIRLASYCTISPAGGPAMPLFLCMSAGVSAVCYCALLDGALVCGSAYSGDVFMIISDGAAAISGGAAGV